ncbi:MAG TPA: AMP-binding protein, partial [Longimicrobium sp.]
PPLPIQYADYAERQREWVNGEVLQRQADYWRTALAGAPELLQLPTDRVRPARQDHVGAFVGFELDATVTAGLKALGRRHGATLFMTMLAGWAAVLGRLSGQEEVVIGAPSANRGRRETRALIGLFVNVLPLRVELSGAPTVAELLARVKERVRAGQENQDIPFEQVVDAVRPGRSLGHAPLFQVMFTWQNTPRGRVSFPGLLASAPGAVSQGQAKFDLSFTLEESGGRIVGGVEYATALFDEATVERYLGYFRAILTAMAEDEDRRVDRLPLLAPVERHQLLRAWNGSGAEYPAESCLHEIFEAQVGRSPESAAVVQDGRSMSYAELNARANRLAHHLRGLGVGPDARVAICVERGCEMMVALLAVLKAGGAYVPLDSAYPAERLRFMLEDSAPVVLLTRGALGELFAVTAVPILDLEGDATAWEHQPPTNPERARLTSDHLAYVIYTSGSTGRPKGVRATHRGVLNLVHWYIRELDLSERDAVLIVTSYSFDLTHRNLFAPLFTGGRLHLAAEPFDPRGILTQIRRSGITMMNLTSTAFHALTDADEGGELGGVRTVVLGGEAPQPGRLLEMPEPRPEFVNAYGPTECSGIVSFHRMDARLERYAARPVPLGRPDANTALYVLDGEGEPVP